MLGNSPFYFRSIEKIVAAFGWIFSDISIERLDPNTSAVLKTIKIPIEYLEKEKWDVRKKEDPNAGDEANQRHINLVLPRMTFELVGYHYDPSRQLPPVNFRVSPSGKGASVMKQLNPVPMIFEFKLYTQTKTQIENWAIIEQFDAFFSPDFVVTIDDIPEMQLRRDIPFIRTGLSFGDDWDGNLLDKRTFRAEHTFEARGHIYPPIKEKKVITSADVRLYAENFRKELTHKSSLLYEVNPPSANVNEPFVIEHSGTDDFEAADFEEIRDNDEK